MQVATSAQLHACTLVCECLVRLSDRFKGVLLNAHIYIYIHASCVKSVVHGNLKPFAESARVVRGRGAADLHPLSQAITETFNRIMRNSSEFRKLLVTSTVLG